MRDGIRKVILQESVPVKRIGPVAPVVEFRNN